MSNRVQTSKIIHDRARQSESSQSRVKSTIHDANEFDSNFENMSDSKTRYLWFEVNRKCKHKFNSVHENIIRVMKLYLIAWLMSDQNNQENWTAWSKTRRMWLCESMRRIWIDLARRMSRRESIKDFDVEKIFMSKETRKIRTYQLSRMRQLNYFKCTMSSMIDESLQCRRHELL
jgi:hypothetical protein